jgi:hypothetical protein
VQHLRDRSAPSRRRWRSPWLIVLAVVLLAAAGGVAYAITRSGPTTPVNCGRGVSCSGSKGHTGKHTVDPLTVATTTPSAGATGVASSTTLTVRFSGPLASGGPTPTISPSIAGSWSRSGDDALRFNASAPFIPFEKYTVTVPGGSAGLKSKTGARLAASDTFTFTVATGNVTRLQQLLAQLGYLPLSYTAPTTAPADMATAQPGTLAWRWSGLPATLTGQWAQGQMNAITKGAIMMFETENGLTVDGLAGPKVWSTLLADVAAQKTNTEPVTYVLVTKGSPEHLTAWVNGSLAFTNILVNTGVRGATTRDGTFQVFEHVRASDMKGCDVTGHCYNVPTVPWASYFNGGDALHGYPRATYGWPQSNGCVEMRITTAGRLWPDTPIGTVVTVQGATATPATSPSSTPPPPTTTTTAPPTTTTTAAPATTTTTTAG